MEKKNSPAFLLLLFAVFLNILLDSCNSENKNTTPPVSNPEAKNSTEPVNAKPDPSEKPVATPTTTIEIVPGKSLAGISLEEEIADVRKKYGDPQGGDAAMGKAWSFWYFHGKPSAQTADSCEIDVFSVRDDPNEPGMKVRQIRTSCQEYKTVSGISAGSSLAEITREFPLAKPIARYRSEPLKATITIYDEVAKGIGFEILVPEKTASEKGKCVAIIVHPAGKKLTQEYLSFYPNLEQL